MGRGLAANLGAKVGDTVVLLANTASGGINAVEVRVRGLFSTITKAYDDVALRVPLPPPRSCCASRARTSGSCSSTEPTDRSAPASLRGPAQIAGLDVVPVVRARRLLQQDGRALLAAGERDES